MNYREDLVTNAIEEVSMRYALNDEVCEGISVKEVKNSMTLIDDICRSAFHERVEGLVYLGISRLTPEAAVCLMSSSSFSGYDITQSNIYAVRLDFSYESVNPRTGEVTNESIFRVFFMPYVDGTGLMYLSGGLYNVRPVLFDKCLSPSNHNVFTRLYKDKSTIAGRNYVVRSNNGYVEANLIYLIPNLSTSVTNLKHSPDPSVFLYLFTKFGYTSAMMKVLGYVPEIILASDEEEKGYHYFYSNELNAETQRYRNNLQPYVPTRIAIRVKESDVSNELHMRSAVVNIMHAFDHDTSVKPQHIENKDIWKIVLAAVLFGNKVPIPEKLNKLDLHLAALDELVDTFMVGRFHQEFGTSLDHHGNVDEDGYYAILAIIYKNFDEWTRTSGYITSSCYDKQIGCLYGLHYITIIAINQLATKLATLKVGVKTTMQTTINTGLTVGHVYGIRRSKGVQALETVAVTSDNRLHGIVTKMALQLNLKSSSNSTKTNTSIVDGSTLLSPSHSIGGSTNSLSKGSVSPLQTLNIFAPLQNGTIVPCAARLASTKKLTEIISKSTRLSTVTKIPREFILTIPEQ